jgi:hypothetical protein
MSRGPAQDDERLFAPERVADLRRAVWELSWLLGRGYAGDSALKLVGDRHALLARQRMAVLRSACTTAAVERRRNRRLRPEALAGRPLAIDGFNQLIAVEVGLSGGVLLLGRDGALRDLAGVHGSYKRGEQTLAAATAIGEQLVNLDAGPVVWWLDQPVSNSGRLRAMLSELSEQRGWGWRIELDVDPDRVLIASEAVVASGDAWILDEAGVHFDLARTTLAGFPPAWIVDLEVDSEPHDLA